MAVVGRDAHGCCARLCAPAGCRKARISVHWAARVEASDKGW
jgi:hypothetical protein